MHVALPRLPRPPTCDPCWPVTDLCAETACACPQPLPSFRVGGRPGFGADAGAMGGPPTARGPLLHPEGPAPASGAPSRREGMSAWPGSSVAGLCGPWGRGGSPHPVCCRNQFPRPSRRRASGLNMKERGEAGGREAGVPLAGGGTPGKAAPPLSEERMLGGCEPVPAGPPEAQGRRW